MSSFIPDVLAHRYASSALVEIWSEEGRVRLERQFWIAVLKGQIEVGLDIPSEALAAYEAVKDQVDLESIRQRERRTRHDVKARIEEFCALAGYEYIHQGLTSRDLTDNVEQYQIKRSLELLQIKYCALLLRLAQRAEQWRDLVIAGRTHYAAAQPTTLGKRLASSGEEMLLAFGRLESLIANYPLRGLKGAVGTSLDQLTLLQDRPEDLARLQQSIRQHLGFSREMNAVGQIYPRSLDFEVLSCLFQLGGGVANFARTWRLMAGTEGATEGFAEGQVGSSAMPHKMNTRSTERINGFQVVLGGFQQMVASLVGDQWFEGDVSCSVVRRVALPGAFFAFDGMLETALHVLDEMGVYEAVLRQDLQRYLPFLTTTTLLMRAVQEGAGREQAHEAIKEHAVAVALDMRERALVHNDLAQRLAADERFPLNAEAIAAALRQSAESVGLARQQVEIFSQQVQQLITRFPQARTLEKGALL